MTISFDQALNSSEFHQTGEFGRPCTDRRGPVRWRRNGKTKTWKTRPGHFSIPVKWGMYSYGHITNYDEEGFHSVEDCPLAAETEVVA